MPLPGTEPATQARALIGSQTSGQNDTQSPRQPTNLSLAGQVSCPLYDHVPLCLFFFNIFFLLFNILFIYFLRGGGKEKERERHINMWLPSAYPLLGTWLGIKPATPWVCRPTLNPLSHTSQGHFLSLPGASGSSCTFLPCPRINHRSKELSGRILKGGDRWRMWRV